MKEVWAIILAAGESRRMGSPKMLLDLKGKKMLEHVIENIIGSGIKNIIVVTGAYKEDITELIERYPVRQCHNQRYKEGMLSSVKCGLLNLPPGFRAALVFQGDQPLIRPATIKIIIDTYQQCHKGITIPLYKNKRGHPILIDRKYRNEIERTDASEGLHALPGKFPVDVMEVETDDPGILKDFDTLEEYLKEINQSSK